MKLAYSMFAILLVVAPTPAVSTAVECPAQHVRRLDELFEYDDSLDYACDDIWAALDCCVQWIEANDEEPIPACCENIMAEDAVLPPECGERRRVLVDDPNRFLKPKELRQTCGDRDYRAHIGVDGDAHLSIFAIPAEWSEDNPDQATAEMQSDECTSVRFHLLNTCLKEIEVWNLSNFGPKALLPLGTYKFHELLDAYQSSKSGNNDGAYDIVTNNCANIVMDMLCALKVPVDDVIIDWTAERLMATNSSRANTMDLLSQSPNYDQLGFPNLDGAGQQWGLNISGGAGQQLGALASNLGQQMSSLAGGTVPYSEVARKLVKHYVTNYISCPAEVKPAGDAGSEAAANGSADTTTAGTTSAAAPSFFQTALSVALVGVFSSSVLWL